jgi:hypothetical protein
VPAIIPFTKALYSDYQDADMQLASDFSVCLSLSGEHEIRHEKRSSGIGERDLHRLRRLHDPGDGGVVSPDRRTHLRRESSQSDGRIVENAPQEFGPDGHRSQRALRRLGPQRFRSGCRNRLLLRVLPQSLHFTRRQQIFASLQQALQRCDEVYIAR